MTKSRLVDRISLELFSLPGGAILLRLNEMVKFGGHKVTGEEECKDRSGRVRLYRFVIVLAEA
jgi:hypothetical protein